MKKWKKVALLLVVANLVGALPVSERTMPFAEPLEVQAFNEKEQQLNDQINAGEQNRVDIINKQDQTEKEINSLEKKKKDLQKKIQELNDELAAVAERIETLEGQIRDKSAEIEITQAELEAAKEKEAWQYACMVVRVREMYEKKENNLVNALIGEGSLSEILNAADYMERVAAYERKMMDQFTAARKMVEETEERLQNEKAELDNLQHQAELEKNKVTGLISQSSKTMADYKDAIADAEKKAKEYEAALKQQEKDLKALRKQLKEEIAMSQLAANSHWRDISEIVFAEGDRYLLANLIYCEAGGEPYAGQVAVGAVVINRVLSSRYPDTVVGVIYQKSQFSPAGSGRLALALQLNKATAKCYQAADEAMAGLTNVGNCLYFRTPIPGLTGINIGGHVFY